MLSAQQRAPILWSVIATTTGDREHLWTDLTADPATAYRAQWGLASSDGFANFLREKIGAKVPISEAKRIAQLIADLDDASFRTGEIATTELIRLGRLAEPAVRSALAKSPSAEQRRRLEGMAVGYERGLSQEELRLRRSIQTLTWSRDPDAKRLLTEWASGMDGAPLTELARSELDPTR